MPDTSPDPPVRPSPIPPLAYNEETLRHPNIFRETFGHLDDAGWLAILKRSVNESVIDGVDFPRFPDPSLQSRLHGSSGEQAVTEAFNLYAFVRHRIGAQLKLGPGARMLDFGSGWGRMLRPFMRHYDLNDIYGFEPSRLPCVIARELNPYVCFLSGEYLPNRRIPRDTFELAIGYSVFSHISPLSASLWLREMTEVLRPGGFGVFTTWGERFLTFVIGQKARYDAGEDMHWYHRFVVEKFGDPEGMLRRYRAGEFVWVDVGQGPLYGEAFLGPRPLQAIIAQHQLPLEVVAFDAQTLPQDAFIVRRT